MLISATQQSDSSIYCILFHLFRNGLSQDIEYSSLCYTEKKKKKEMLALDFPGGPVVKNPSVNAGDTGLIPGPGRFHLLWSNEAHGPQLLSLCSRAWEPNY